MISAADEQHLRHALRIAVNGRGRVEPNPMVGCVLAKDGRVIGEGWHAQFGGPHAEPTALEDCRARGESPTGATAYVTLEPCCHLNKKTPPCAPRLIDARVARVVIGCLDPNPDVNGSGVKMLRSAGIIVDTAPPLLAGEFQQVLAPFFTGLRRSRPYVTLKWAQTSAGIVGGPGNKPLRITGPAATAAVHRLRTRCHAIAVGINTALSDDPALTVRGVPIVNQPLRYVIDRHLRLPPSARVLRDGPPCRIICRSETLRTNQAAAAALRRAGGECVPVDDAAFRDGSLLDEAVFPGMAGKHLLVEPGPTLAKSWMGWADRLWVITSSTGPISPPDSPRAAPIPNHFKESGRLTFDDDTVVEYLNLNAPGFAAVHPSADLVLENMRLP